jgi:hypothetical protein
MRTYNIILKGIDAVEFPPRNISRQATALIKKLCRLGARLIDASKTDLPNFCSKLVDIYFFCSRGPDPRLF